MELLRCPDCEALVVPPARTCDRCGAPRLEPATVTGSGTLYSFTTIHAPPAELADQAPGVRQAAIQVAVVRLDEGVLLAARLDAGVDAEVQIDSAVMFDHTDERGFVFRLLAD